MILLNKLFIYRVWDCQTGTKLTYCASHGNKMSRITALEFINAHDITLLMAGSDDGSVRVWKNYSSMLNRDPVLLTAWQAMADIQPATKATTGMYILEYQWIYCNYVH